jgi:threonine synthase
VEQATGFRPPLPPRMADLYQREERYEVMPNDLSAIEAAVRGHARRNAA